VHYGAARGEKEQEGTIIRVWKGGEVYVAEHFVLAGGIPLSEEWVAVRRLRNELLFF